MVDGDELRAVGKVASTWMSGIISATPSMTWSARDHMGADSMSSATLRPSRAPSTTRVGDQRDRLRVIELDPSLEPPARNHGRHRDEKFVLFTGREIHGRP